MQPITTVQELESHYGTPGEASLKKVASRLTRTYGQFIARSRFCILSTVGPEGTDCSPRGDLRPVVKIVDDQTLAMPDWRGNERIDSLRNIVRDGRVSLIFLIPGSNTAIRVNGRAVVTADETLRRGFTHQDKMPRSVIVITLAEVYSQCARALIRSELWVAGDQSAGLPTPGDMLRDITDGGFDGASYDAAWPERAAKTMW